MRFQQQASVASSATLDLPCIHGSRTNLFVRSLLSVLVLSVLGGPTIAEDTVFEELTGSGFEFDHFNGMSGEFYMAEINCGGGAVFDYDNDGDLDLYLVQGTMLGDRSVEHATFPPRHQAPLTDRLFRNDLKIGKDGRRTLTFTDVTAESGDLGSGYGFGVAAGDYDGDGWVDLYVTQLGSNLLLRNKGPGVDGTVSFEDVTASSGANDPRWSVAASFVDYDRDGNLDLWVGNYLEFELSKHKVCRAKTGAQDYCGPSAHAGVPDRLLRNIDGRRFEDVSVAAGIYGTPSKTLGVVAADFDGNQVTDFYVASDQTANSLWIQQADGTFSDEALLAGCAVNANGKAEASMGVDAGDFDQDGDLDLFMTHLVSETNTLFVNDGSGNFDDLSSASGLGLPSWGYTSWGTAWIDFDNDGDLDLMTANGAVKVIEALANAGDPYPFHEPNQLFRNVGAVGQLRFEVVPADRSGPSFQLSEVSRALASGDLDNDGDADIVLINNNGPARILINQVGQRQHWLGLRLVTGEPLRDALGASVRLLRPGGGAIIRRAHTDGGFAAAKDPRILIGLGQSDAPSTVRVSWLSGRQEDFVGLASNTYVTLQEGKGKESK